MLLHLYQTLRNDGNFDYVEKNGPFDCTRDDAWLGFGYYFWDAHMELAHWWGKVAYKVKGNSYVICQAYGTYDESCWDLHGNGLHQQEFISICDEMIRGNISTKEDMLVPQIIEFFKIKGAFKYQAIRALGVKSFKESLKDRNLIYRMNFSRKYQAFIDLVPPVQICLLTKQALSLRNYRIVYPINPESYYTGFG